MIYIILSFLSGIISGCITLYFRLQEIRTKTIIFGKHFFLQMIALFVMLLFFQSNYSYIEVVLPFFTLSWLWIFLICSTMGYYLVQVFFEYFTEKKFFAPKDELEAYLEKLEKEKDI